jgi:hypothetical protein
MSKVEREQIKVFFELYNEMNDSSEIYFDDTEPLTVTKFKVWKKRKLIHMQQMPP